jgi:hypothetical protein
LFLKGKLVVLEILVGKMSTDKLEKLQLEAARIVTGLPAYASRDSLYLETGWEKLIDRRNMRCENIVNIRKDKIR